MDSLGWIWMDGRIAFTSAQLPHSHGESGCTLPHGTRGDARWYGGMQHLRSGRDKDSPS